MHRLIWGSTTGNSKLRLLSILLQSNCPKTTRLDSTYFYITYKRDTFATQETLKLQSLICRAMLMSIALTLSLEHTCNHKATPTTFLDHVIGNWFNLFPSSHYLSETANHRHQSTTIPQPHHPFPCIMDCSMKHGIFHSN